MSGSQIVAIDCGTQSVRAVIVNVETGAHRVGATEAIDLLPARGNRIEIDPMQLAFATIRVLRETITLCATPPTAIAITNMRETAIAWHRDSGEPVHGGIMWMSQQSQNIVQRWDHEGISELIRERTGLTNHTFFFGSKIAWLFDAYPDIRAEAKSGRIAVGTVESWLLFILTGGTVHATDVSNASRYQLLSLTDREWDAELMATLDIPLAALPQVFPTSAHFGRTDADVVGASIPITGMIGDQQASLLGHGCVEVGDAKATFGTSCVVGVNIGDRPRLGDGLVTSVAWSQPGESAVYEIEGSAFHSGYTISWLRRILSMQDAGHHSLKRSALPSHKRVTVIPSFTELGAPRWLKGNGASISGLAMDTEPEDLIRAGVESMAFQAHDLLSAVPTGWRDRPFSVDGGAASNDYLCQLLADLSGRTIVRPPNRELTGFGAAKAAAATFGAVIPTESGHDEQAMHWFAPAEDRSYALSGYDHWSKVTVAAHKDV